MFHMKVPVLMYPVLCFLSTDAAGFDDAHGVDVAHGVGPRVRRRSRLCFESNASEVKVSEYRRKHFFEKFSFF